MTRKRVVNASRRYERIVHGVICAFLAFNCEQNRRVHASPLHLSCDICSPEEGSPKRANFNNRVLGLVFEQRVLLNFYQTFDPRPTSTSFTSPLFFEFLSQLCANLHAPWSSLVLVPSRYFHRCSSTLFQLEYSLLEYSVSPGIRSLTSCFRFDTPVIPSILAALA